MKAALFPGQGVRIADLLAALPGDHPLVEEAETTLSLSLRQRLGRIAATSRAQVPTELAQPALVVAGLVAYERAVEQGATFAALAGHSLGEYTALAAGGALRFRDVLRLVAARGEAMAAAARTAPGGMAAVLGLDIGNVEDLASEHGATVANDNAPGEVVVSGPDAALDAIAAAARTRGGRAIRLGVTGPFHSPAMEPAVARLQSALDAIEIRSPHIPVLSNTTARPYRAPGEIRKLLTAQLTGRVRWRESIEWLYSKDVSTFVDMGPGEVVGKLARRTIEPLARGEATPIGA